MRMGRKGETGPVRFLDLPLLLSPFPPHILILLLAAKEKVICWKIGRGPEMPLSIPSFFSPPPFSFFILFSLSCGLKGAKRGHGWCPCISLSPFLGREKIQKCCVIRSGGKNFFLFRLTYGLRIGEEESAVCRALPSFPSFQFSGST